MVSENGRVNEMNSDIYLRLSRQNLTISSAYLAKHPQISSKEQAAWTFPREVSYLIVFSFTVYWRKLIPAPCIWLLIDVDCTGADVWPYMYIYTQFSSVHPNWPGRITSNPLGLNRNGAPCDPLIFTIKLPNIVINWRNHLIFKPILSICLPCHPHPSTTTAD
jgi:hypothetical protein